MKAFPADLSERVKKLPDEALFLIGVTRVNIDTTLSIKDLLHEKGAITQSDINNNPHLWTRLLLTGTRVQWEYIANMDLEKDGDDEGVLLEALKLFFLGRGDMLDILTEDSIDTRSRIRPIFDFVISRFL